MTSALGKYAHQVTAGIVVLILVSWAIVHVLEAVGVVLPEYDSTQLDTFALAAFTYLLGNVSALNGLKPDIEAANRRLDAVGAPAAGSIDQGDPNPHGYGPSVPPEGGAQ